MKFEDVGTKTCHVSTQQAERVCSMELEIYLASKQDNQSWVFLPRHASQFDPAIDKERKFISNLRWNMLVLPDSSEYMALRADVEGDRLNSRF